MEQHLEEMKRRVRDGEHNRWRQDSVPDVLAECEAEGLSWVRRAARLTRRMCEAERPVIEPDERIVFTRTLRTIPPVYSPADWAARTAGRTVHELGCVNNICADWGMILSQGLLGRRQVALESRQRLADQPEVVEFLDAAVETIDAVLGLAARYAHEARELGRLDVAALLERVPAHPAKTFHEALQALRVVHAVLWLSGHYQNAFGRLDQYLWPYLEADLRAGRLDSAGAQALLAEFFIASNKDADLYPGVQKGDNGQTLVLGGVRPDGTCGVNGLTRLALRAALEVSMIDPKINLRIDPGTDLDLLSLASELTRKGLGFPQYSNDAVVIPGLVAHGYDLADARDYVMAACWEFIIPGKGMEVVNTGAVSFPAAVDRGLREALPAGGDFQAVLEGTRQDVRRQVERVVGDYRRLILPPAPYYSIMLDGCLEQGRDASEGLKYNNFGIHGAASANAADALAAVRKLVFEEQSIDRATLLRALDANWEGYEPLRCRLAEEGPRVGNDDDAADELLVKLFGYLAQACDAAGDNGRGGRVRPGTGSAMYYVWLARGNPGMREPVVGATAEGRRVGDLFGANLAPAQGVRVRGPISTLRSFSKIDYQRICNGGPITLELSDAVFRDAESISKVAMLVRTFAQVGCQQLQVNTVNLETLLDAKAHPERHKNLIVRVWGWSGYFCELAPEYQDHIIARQMHTMV